MNLIEKMAQENLESMGYDPYYENGLCQNSYDDVRGSYEEGFRAARQMIHDVLKTRMCSLEESDWDRLKTMGDEEVE